MKATEQPPLNNFVQAVLTPPDRLYLDHSYEPDFEERGLYWAADYTDNKKIFEYSPTEHIGNSSESLVNLLGKSVNKL